MRTDKFMKAEVLHLPGDFHILAFGTRAPPDVFAEKGKKMMFITTTTLLIIQFIINYVPG
jgi:hypothetical protein